jgi:hypothetical protein
MSIEADHQLQTLINRRWGGEGWGKTAIIGMYMLLLLQNMVR